MQPQIGGKEKMQKDKLTDGKANKNEMI